MDDDLLPDVPRPLRRFEVRVTAIRCDSTPGPVAFAEAARKAVADAVSEDVESVHTAEHVVAVITVRAQDDEEAARIGESVVAGALGGETGPLEVDVRRAAAPSREVVLT